MSVIVDDLEQQCRRIARKVKDGGSDSTPATYIGREIALTLDHIDAVREQQRELGRRFVEKELYIDTQVMNLKCRPCLKDIWVTLIRLKNDFNQMLDRAERHAQRLALEIGSVLRQLQVRLMELWNMYDQLSVENGDSTNSA